MCNMPSAVCVMSGIVVERVTAGVCRVYLPADVMTLEMLDECHIEKQSPSPGLDLLAPFGSMRPRLTQTDGIVFLPERDSKSSGWLLTKTCDTMLPEGRYISEGSTHYK